MAELLFQSAARASRMVSRREVCSRHLTEMLLARIDGVNPVLNAVVELRREAALREAAEADEATARGDDLGRCTVSPSRAMTASTSRGCTPPGAIPPLAPSEMTYVSAVGLT